MLDGASLAGGRGLHDRVEHDYYATDPQSVKDLLDFTGVYGKSFYEPCVGEGHIVDVLKEYYPYADFHVSDIVDRGYKHTVVKDFLTEDTDFTVDWVITNPPYKHAQAFITKSLTIANIGVAMFLKIQFLEGQGRKEWFKENPPKYVYVFSKRQSPWRDGQQLNPKTGKKWDSTMCFAWFVWEKGNTNYPILRWL